jgi:hypothetical protein
MNRVSALVAVLAAAAFVSGCGSSPTDSAAASAVTITANADPVNATASTDAAYTWAASVPLTLTESGGVAFDIASVNAKIEPASAGIVVVSTEATTFRYQLQASGNHVVANGSLPVTVNFLYTIPGGGREALVTIVFTIYDDAGYAYQQSKQVKVV